MACHTQQEIAEAVECGKATVAQEIMQNGKLADLQQAAADHLTDFKPPFYNVWKFKERPLPSARPSRRPRRGTRSGAGR